MFKCIDFDEKYSEFVSKWMEANKGKYRNFDAMEADLPRVYTVFLNTPAPWLDGLTPGSYFSQYEDPKDLVDWMVDYCVQGVPVPDQLLEQIQFVGKPCEKRLMNLLKDDTASQDARMTAIGLLRDMDSTQPKMLYIGWQLEREQDDELADNALDSLAAMGKSVVQQLLDALPRANDAGQEALLDILVNYSQDDRVYRATMRLFTKTVQRRALFASYLAKLGDSRALPELMAAANDPACSYCDFIELRNAIEVLGGEAPDRDFSEDPDYEAIHDL